jgi:outer membrane protein assembly factor BamB
MRLFLFIIAIISLYCFSFAQYPYIRWQFDTQDMSFGNACAADIDADGWLEIVFSTYFNDKHIYALNAENGTLLWKYDIGGCSDAAPVIYDVDGDGKLDVILHSSCVPYMFCFNGEDGSLKWKIHTRATDSPPSVADIDNDGKAEIFGGDFGGFVFCLNGFDGSMIWETLVDSNFVVQTEPVLSDLDGDANLDLCIATYNLIDTNFNSKCFIAAYKTNDGSLLWKSKENTFSIYHGPTIADVDADSKPEVIISDYSGTLYCLNGEDGSTAWKFKFPQGTYSGTPTTIADLDNNGNYEIIYFCDDRLGVLSGDGKLLWAHRMLFGSYTFRGAIVTDVDGDTKLDIVYGNNSGWLTAINGQNGGLIWNLNFEEIYGKRFDLLHGPLAADFNKDGALDIFFVGGWAEFPDVQKNYGRAYMITAGKGKGPDWLMFRRDATRNAVLPIEITSIDDSKSSYDIPFHFSFSDNTRFLKIKTDKPFQNNLRVIIYDIFGNRKFITSIQANQFGNLNFEIDCNNLATGAYFISLTATNEIYTGKFIIY